MAKARIIELPQTRGSFQVSGLVSGCEKNNFYTEKDTKTGRSMHMVSFGVKINQDDDTVFVGLNGTKNDTVYFNRRADKEKGILSDTKAVPWADRYSFEAEGYNLIGVRTGVERKKNENGKEENVRKTLTPYDACEEIAAHLRDDHSVFVRGDLEYSQFGGTHRTRFNINQVSRTRDIDMEAEGFAQNAKFTQPIVFMGIAPDPENNRAIVEAKVVGYENIEDIELFVYDKALASLFKKNLKPYTYINVWGDIQVTSNTESVDNSGVWGTQNSMTATSSPVSRDLVITGADPTTIDTSTYSADVIDEAIAKIAAKNQAKNDYGSSASPWGTASSESSLDITVGDDEEPW